MIIKNLLGQTSRNLLRQIPKITKKYHFNFTVEDNNRIVVGKVDEKRFQQIRMHSTMSQYPGLNSKVRNHEKNKIKVVQDKETGLRFLVQTGGFPGCSDMGICVKLGTQDQNQNNAGSLQNLKSFVHMKPTFEQLVTNYQILTQTGSTFDLNYDSMSTYAKCSFLQQDQDLMIDLLLDLVIQQKNMFQDNSQTQIDLSSINQLVRRTAFGGKGLGMPSRGIGNILTNKQFLKFQQKITPKNMIIAMSNMTNPEQVIDRIKEKIKTKYPNFLKRTPQPTISSTYIGGLGTYQSNGEMFQFAIAYPSVASRSEHMELFNVLRVILGTASSFSSGGPGKGMHSRCTRNLLNSIQCVEKASFINQHFDNHGLFGLTVGGPHNQRQHIIECTLVQLFKLLHQIPEQELDRAKHILISSIYQNIERNSDRLQQLSKHIFYYGKIKLYQFEHNIRKVTSKQIQSLMKEIFNKKPTLVYSGNEQSIKNLPNQNQLNQYIKQIKADLTGQKKK